MERAIEASGDARIKAIPVPVRDVWNPDTCPVKLLPWLAWAFSVDTWNPSWTETQQRAIIKNSLLIHKYKGTIGAIRRSLEAIGYSWKLVEWFEDDPPGPHHTFRIEIGITGQSIDEATYNTIAGLIADAKNVRSQLSTMLVKSDVSGNIHVACATLSGCEDEIEPYFAGVLQNELNIYFASYLLNGERTFIIPDGADPSDYEDADIWDGGTGPIDPSAFTFEDGTYPDGGVGPIDPEEYEIVGTP